MYHSNRNNTMPELTKTELAHLGRYTVSWYEPDLKCLVVAKHCCSVECFMDKNHLPKMWEALVRKKLDTCGSAEVMTEHGNVHITQ